MARQTAGPGAQLQATLTNSPTRLKLTLVKAKSFSFGVRLTTADEERADITGCLITLHARNAKHKGYVLVLEKDAELTDPLKGEARFNLQAADTDLTQGEYTFDITMLSSDGYTSNLTQGILTIIPSTESDGVGHQYATPTPEDWLLLRITQQNEVTFQVGKISALELEMGYVSTAQPGDPWSASITGSYPKQKLNLSLPPTGAQGPPGPPGPPGSGGGDGTASEVFHQGTPASTWTVNHSMPFRPNISVVDSAGTQVEGEVSYTSSTQIVLTFSAAFSGTAYMS